MTLGTVSLEELRKKFTEEEIVILLNTTKYFRYITRNCYGTIQLFSRKPKKLKKYGWWHANPYSHGKKTILCDFSLLFQNIKWEDEEPYKFR